MVTTTHAGTIYAGHCLCGRTRYCVAAEPLWRCYCHCDSCRRATGAPVTAFVGFPAADFLFQGEAPGRVQSSPGVTRTFCRHCGTPLTYQTARRPTEIDLLLGSLDDPAQAAVAPLFHVFDGERIPWMDAGADLPRHRTIAGASPEASPGASPTESSAESG